MRRTRMTRLVALFLVLTTAWLWIPEVPPDPIFSHAAPAGAQPTIPLVGPGGVVVATMSSVSITNTTASTPIFVYTIPAPMVATSSFTSTAGTVTSTNVVAASLPLHLHCEGTINTASSPGAYNVGVNFGGANATINLVNGITPGASISNQPLSLDVYVAPIATSTSGAVGGGATVFLRGRWAYQLSNTISFASETAHNAAVVGSTSIRSAQTLRVDMQWGTASNSNAVNIYSCVLVQGN